MIKLLLFLTLSFLQHQNIFAQEIIAEGNITEICSICHNSLEGSGLSAPFKCKHEFHSGCINRWLENRSTCPLCRQELDRVTINNEFVWAAAEGNQEQVEQMLRDGADVNSIDTSGDTALMLSSFGNGGNPEMIRILLNAGADISKSPDILVLASAGASPETLRLLLNTGINVNRANNLGVTPLMEAATYGNTEAVRLLLQNGANKDLRDLYQNRTALDWANWGKNMHRNINPDNYDGAISLLN